MDIKNSIILALIYILFFSNFVFAKTKNKKDSVQRNSFSFRPLLIQGKKQFSDKSKDLKVEGENVAESEILSIKVDFKNRIFDLGNM